MGGNPNAYDGLLFVYQPNQQLPVRGLEIGVFARVSYPEAFVVGEAVSHLALLKQVSSFSLPRV